MPKEDKDFEKLVTVLEQLPYNQINKKAIAFISKRFDQYSYLMSVLDLKRTKSL